MEISYQILFIFEDHQEIVSLIEKSIETLSDPLFFKNINFYKNTFSQSMIKEHSVVIFIGSSLNAQSESCRNLIEQALEKRMLIIPISIDQNSFINCIPERLTPYLAYYWEDNKHPEKEMARITLEKLGLSEKEKKLFISYRRIDGSALATQLYDALNQRKYDVFLDKFDIDIGDDVQQNIFDSIGDMAFLLILESDRAIESKWMKDELFCALRNKLGILVISWTVDHQIPETKGLPRIQLESDQIISSGNSINLTDDSLEDIFLKIEEIHADSFIRRRRNLVFNIENKWTSIYSIINYLDNWILFLSDPIENPAISIDKTELTDNLLVMITPRPPKPEDLFLLDKYPCNIQTTNPICKIIFYYSMNFSEKMRLLLDWIIENKSIRYQCVDCLEVKYN